MPSDVMGPPSTARTLPWPSVSPPVGPSFGPCPLRLARLCPASPIPRPASLCPHGYPSIHDPWHPHICPCAPRLTMVLFHAGHQPAVPGVGGHTCPRQPSRWPPDTLTDGPTLPPGPYNNTRPSGHLRSLLGRPEAQAWGQEAPGLAALKASFSLGLLPPPPAPPAE